MDATELVCLAFALLAGGGLFAMLACRAGRLAPIAAASTAVVGGVLGLVGSVRLLVEPGARAIGWLGDGALVGADPLAAFFLVPLFALGGIAAAFGGSYMSSRTKGATLGLTAGAFNILLAAMVVVLLARTVMLFLVAWEVMTLVAYASISFDHDEAEVRRAGWSYLIASHVGMMALLAMFLLLSSLAGGELGFAELAAGDRSSSTMSAVILLLALLGFGVKAGVVGLHVWLPEAHAAAPSHVSAIMSAVLIKLGLYGLLRVLTWIPAPSWFGVLLAALGLAGAAIGIVLALYQRDLKRVLAYSSIENVGLVLLALGTGVWAASRGATGIAALATAAGLFHVWNHAAMKGLMFLGAGSIVHATGTRDLEQLGGLLRRMPRTGTLWIIGAVAISGLPPLNGFASEWLLYRALLDIGLRAESTEALAGVAAVAMLAIVGAVAVLCFVRLIGIALLGEPRSDAAESAHESPPMMTGALVLLATMCLLCAALPGHVLRLHGVLVAELVGTQTERLGVIAETAAPIAWLSIVLLCVLAMAGAAMAWRRRGASTTATWGCGYAAPSARMQYTSRSFSELLVERMLPARLRFQARVTPPQGALPRHAAYSTDASDPLTRGAYEPLFRGVGDGLARLRWLQRGSLHLYLLYIVVVLVLGLAWASIREVWT